MKHVATKLYVEQTQAAETSPQEWQVHACKGESSAHGSTAPHPVLTSRSRSTGNAALSARQAARVSAAPRNAIVRHALNPDLPDHHEPDQVLPQSNLLSTLRVRSELDDDLVERKDPLKFRELTPLECKEPRSQSLLGRHGAAPLLLRPSASTPWVRNPEPANKPAAVNSAQEAIHDPCQSFVQSPDPSAA